MIAARYTQGKGFEVTHTEVPAIADNEILLKVEASGICGTDLKIVQNGHRKLKDDQTITLGHEFVGVVDKLGSRVTGYALGSRVGVAPNIGCGSCEMCSQGLFNMCPDFSAFGIDRDGAQAEYVVIPATAIAQRNLFPISAQISSAEACLAEPLSCAISGVRAAQVKLGDVVVVYGAGPMGLLNIMVAVSMGASRVVAIDVNDKRLEYAKQVGASDSINPRIESVHDWVTRETNNVGVNAVITAVPVPAVQQEALTLLAPYGRLCLFAGLARGSGGVELDTNAIHYKQLTVTGVTGGSRADHSAALRMIESGRINVRAITSEVYSFNDLAQAYERAKSGEGLKIVVTANAKDGAQNAL